MSLPATGPPGANGSGGALIRQLRGHLIVLRLFLAGFLAAPPMPPSTGRSLTLPASRKNILSLRRRRHKSSVNSATSAQLRQSGRRPARDAINWFQCFNVWCRQLPSGRPARDGWQRLASCAIWRRRREIDDAAASGIGAIDRRTKQTSTQRKWPVGVANSLAAGQQAVLNV